MLDICNTYREKSQLPIIQEPSAMMCPLLLSLYLQTFEMTNKIVYHKQYQEATVFCVWLKFTRSKEEDYSSNIVLCVKGWNLDQLDWSR